MIRLADWWWRWRRNVSFSISASLSLFSALTLYSHAHLWSIKLSMKMRVSSNELFSTLKSRLTVPTLSAAATKVRIFLLLTYGICQSITGKYLRNGNEHNCECSCECQQHIFSCLSSHFLSSSSEQIFQLQVPIWSISKHCRKLALVGIILNQILFSFSSDKLFHLIRLSVLLSLSELKEKRIWKHCSTTHQQAKYRSFFPIFWQKKQWQR